MAELTPQSVYLPIDLVMRDGEFGAFALLLFPQTNRYMHLDEPQLREMHGQLSKFITQLDAKKVGR